jgi:flagellar M-ring protein FliF
MLERVVGPGHADVRVTADLDPARIERLEERYDPTHSALRSEEQSIERVSGEADDTVAGVPGAESNLPGGAAKGATASASASGSPSATPAPAAPGTLRESHTRNFEVDHVTEKRTTASGTLRRLTIAVMLDGQKGDQGTMVERPRAELDRLAQLVRSASGANEARGDLVTVESMPFALAEAEPVEPAPAPPSKPTKLELAKRWGPYAAAGLIVLVGMIVALRRRASARASDAVAALGSGDAPEVRLATAVAPAPIPATPEVMALPPAKDVGDLRARAHARAGEDPATAALVLRFWLGTSTSEAPSTNRAA